MDSDDFIALAERDAQIVEALVSAFRAMSLVNGCGIVHAGIAGTLRFENEILKLHHALLLLGIESTGFGHLSG